MSVGYRKHELQALNYLERKINVFVSVEVDFVSGHAGGYQVISGKLGSLW